MHASVPKAVATARLSSACTHPSVDRSTPISSGEGAKIPTILHQLLQKVTRSIDTHTCIDQRYMYMPRRRSFPVHKQWQRYGGKAGSPYGMATQGRRLWPAHLEMVSGPVHLAHKTYLFLTLMCSAFLPQCMLAWFLCLLSVPKNKPGTGTRVTSPAKAGSSSWIGKGRYQRFPNTVREYVPFQNRTGYLIHSSSCLWTAQLPYKPTFKSTPYISCLSTHVAIVLAAYCYSIFMDMVFPGDLSTYKAKHLTVSIRNYKILG